ncbi:NAD(P)-dependent oxidoreductase [Pelagicoccus sp. SDUM812003]|uniref:NAD-dependent epimerase/dehydratase family protein n=1 Tax=Pelagicoccus sp. SDUM812003 TaxID=3041267 RepID=UPI00281073A9|nr:NAD(P)-dependent oxidoreductase [Pelagicoccus sp. SDUM812003]MDQ8204663.1 NAD(P)-dependent oxidoreductase [Pelagicoccus sp. SDUM812003]
MTKPKLLITGGSGFIGTNAVAFFDKLGWKVTNLDKSLPLNSKQLENWEPCDILEIRELKELFQRLQPDYVIHLAARAECDESTTVEKGYRANTEGTENVLSAVQSCESIKRLIVTSSQFVCGPGYTPEGPEDYSPGTVYGQSKVITEKLTRAAKLDCAWTLIRPTNIWGPWHQRYLSEFWRIAARGLYIHPGGQAVTRCYGYVGNLVHWLRVILESEASVVDRETFYLSDPADDIYKWANAFCRALNGRRAIRVPRPVLATLGHAGDLISMIQGKPFYINSSRYRSMTSDYLVPGEIERTIEALGPAPFSLEEGVETSVKWIRSTDRRTASSARHGESDQAISAASPQPART